MLLQYQVEGHIDERKINREDLANHEGAWTCPQPFYMEDWIHRVK